MLFAQTIAAAQYWFIQSYLFKNAESFSLKKTSIQNPQIHTLAFNIICAWKYPVERNKLGRGFLNNLTDTVNKNYEFLENTLNLLAFCSCGNTCGFCALRL